MSLPVAIRLATPADAEALAAVFARSARAKGAPVGFAVLENDMVRMIYTAPEAPRGAGSALIERIVGAAERRGLSELWLNGSFNALGFYERHGFREVRRIRRAPTGAVEIEVAVWARASR